MDYANARIAEIYELTNGWGPDYDFYVALVGDRPSRVLDLGCGTGTLCCALAERGHRVTGVEPAAAMLEIARKKPHGEKVEWVEASAQTYRSGERFDWIVMMGHAFQVFLSDADALAAFNTMHGHLKNDGKAAFETRNPQIDWAAEWAGRIPQTRTLGGEQFVESLQVERREGEFISFQTSYQFSGEKLTTQSTLRFPSHKQVAELITRSGLSVVNVFGEWDGSPFDGQRSREIIFVAGRSA